MSSSAPDDTVAMYLRRIEALTAQLITADDPYQVGVELWSVSLGTLEAGTLSGNMCALWGALTDWAERKPDEEPAAKAEMVRAAQAWLALDPHDHEAVESYFDYWLHGVCRYERDTD
ncbi:hypothetical protein ACIBSW_06695 [Actinoplanes sp. NPDC049668]|uniref:hypothetical protein n=1 Tax=unclassified Actinoplanes TaxID=2626549 RepID=UPI0033A579AC